MFGHDYVRDAFMARMLGIFSEEIAHAWCDLESSPYEYLGRPTVTEKGAADSRRTLDLTLRRKRDQHIFLAEAKCWVAFEKGRHLSLGDPEDLNRVARNSKSFAAFLRFSADPALFTATNRPPRRDVREAISPAGAILVWSVVAEDERASAMRHFGFHEVLSFEAMLDALQAQPPSYWTRRLKQIRSWSNQLVDFIARG